MMRDISEFTDVELMRELLMRNKVSEAPRATQRGGDWSEAILEINKDHVAYLTLDDEAYDKLMLE